MDVYSIIPCMDILWYSNNICLVQDYSLITFKEIIYMNAYILSWYLQYFQALFNTSLSIVPALKFSTYKQFSFLSKTSPEGR